MAVDCIIGTVPGPGEIPQMIHTAFLTPFQPVTRHINMITGASRRYRCALVVHTPIRATKGSPRQMLASPHPLSNPASRVHIWHG